MNHEKLTVYLADDHTIVRKGMVRLLKTFQRVGVVMDAANGKELIRITEITPPDAVILDLEMPVMGGVETSKHLVNNFPNVKILILTMHTEAVFIHTLMDIGIHGFLSKSAEPDEVERALYSIIDKDFYKNEIVENAMRKNISLVTPETTSKLSSRELEVLLLICQELSPAEISERLQISEKTFFNHRANILTKTRSRSNVGLLRFAVQRGLYELS
ncbi:MAG: response regulator transcription factor [Cyclobacteriaceae bacterium]|nr:response regulator transcription factor [Cyclobacteriaceae bacterium]